MPRTRLAAAAATVVGLAGLLLAGVDVYIGNSTIPSTVTCDSTVSTRTAFVDAINSTGSSGQTICVTADITGLPLTRTADGGAGEVFTDMTSEARFIAQPADGSISMVPICFCGASNITIEGFDFTAGGLSLDTTTSGIHVVGNFFHDMDGGNAIETSNGSGDSTGVWFIGNYVHDLSADPATGGGYGAYFNTCHSCRVEYNTFDMHPVDDGGGSADAMQLGTIDNTTIIGNDVRHVNWFGAEADDPHADSLMIWANSSGVTVRDNRFLNGNGLLFANIDDLTADNNLVWHMDNDCWQNGFISNSTYSNNTVAGGCQKDFNGGVYQDDAGVSLDQASSTNNLLVANVLPNVADGASITTGSHDNLTNASWTFGGTNNQGGFLPLFAATDEDATFAITNLPGGFEGSGYQNAPAGYLNAP